jgi:hypothetical protein
MSSGLSTMLPGARHVVSGETEFCGSGSESDGLSDSLCCEVCIAPCTENDICESCGGCKQVCCLSRDAACSDCGECPGVLGLCRDCTTRCVDCCTTCEDCSSCFSLREACQKVRDGLLAAEYCMVLACQPVFATVRLTIYKRSATRAQLAASAHLADSAASVVGWMASDGRRCVVLVGCVAAHAALSTPAFAETRVRCPS